MAAPSPARPRPVGGVDCLVRHLQSNDAAEQARAAACLVQFINRSPGTRHDISASIAAADGIPALLRLLRGPDEHPGAASACWLLSELAVNSPARCQAILAAGGVAPLARCLQSGSVAGVQAGAAFSLGNLAAAQRGGDLAGKAAVAPAAMQAAIQRLSSDDEMLLRGAALLLNNLADCPPRKEALRAGGGIPALASLLRHPCPDVVAPAAATLSKLALSVDSEARAVAVAAAAAPSLVALLASSSRVDVVEPCSIAVFNMLHGPPVIAMLVIEAGGIPALVRCLRCQQFASDIHDTAAEVLGRLADGGPQPSALVTEAGGIQALIQALASPCPDVKASAACSLQTLVLHGQAAAVAAADPAGAVTAALEWLPTSSRLAEVGQDPQVNTRALSLLAAARRSVRTSSAAGAPAAQAAPPAATAAQPAPRVCAAPGCGATAGLKRCKGCGTVRYCGEACMRAHWREHRPECKRVRAAAAAAAGGAAGPSSSGQQA